jgi:hypothetical protein
VNLSSEPQDVDSQYLESLENLRTRKPISRPPVDRYAVEVQEAKDYYANIRSNVCRSNLNPLRKTILTRILVLGASRLGAY